MLIYQSRRNVIAIVAPTTDENVMFQDDFNGVSLDAGWSQISSNCPTIASFDGSQMTFKPDVAGSAATGKQGFGYRRSDVPATGSFYIECDFSSNDASATAYNYSGLFLVSTVDNSGFFNGRSPTFNAFLAIGFNYTETGNWSFSGWNSLLTGQAFIAGTHRFRLSWDEADATISASFRNSVTGLWTTFYTRAAIRPNRYGVALHGNNIHADHTQTNDKIVLVQRGTAVITASSQLDGNNIPAYAFDSRFDRGWHSVNASLPQWIQEAKSSATYVGRVFITSNNFSRLRDPKDFRLDGSNDGGTTWTTLGTWTNEAWTGNGQRREFVMTNPGSYSTRRLVITVVNNDPNDFASIGELEITV